MQLFRNQQGCIRRVFEGRARGSPFKFPRLVVFPTQYLPEILSLILRRRSHICIWRDILMPAADLTNFLRCNSVCILVFGISGSGKTTACRNAMSAVAGLEYVSASELLRGASRASSESFGGRSARDVAADQFLLAELLAEFRSEHGGKSIIIDAHATIPNREGLLTVPLEVIAALKPSAIALIEKDAFQVLAQRKGDATRQRPSISLQQVVAEMAAERFAAESYAHSLNVPFGLVRTGAHESLLDFIETALAV